MFEKGYLEERIAEIMGAKEKDLLPDIYEPGHKTLLREFEAQRRFEVDGLTAHLIQSKHGGCIAGCRYCRRD
jgi:hypothetical protein